MYTFYLYVHEIAFLCTHFFYMYMKCRFCMHIEKTYIQKGIFVYMFYFNPLTLVNRYPFAVEHPAILLPIF